MSATGASMRSKARFLPSAVSVALAAGTAVLGIAQPAARAVTTVGQPVPVIVFLRSQAVSQPIMAPYLSQAMRAGATGVIRYHLLDAFAATMPAPAATRLAASPGVARVIPDSIITGPAPVSAPPPAAAGPGTPPAQRPAQPPARPAAQPGAQPMTGACAASGTPQLEPEALGLTGTDSATPGARTARSLGYTGAGVKVAFLADGLDPANSDFRRPAGGSVFADYQDFTGDGRYAPTSGAQAFMDASAIAGQGRRLYDAAGFAAGAPRGHCLMRVEGVAPGASLVALKVFNSQRVSTTSGFLQAIDYAVTTDHANVLSESFGAGAFPDVTSLDAVQRFNDAAVAAGATVVAATGGAGGAEAIGEGTATTGSPASDPHVLSVGASTGFRFYAQTNYAGADTFAAGGWLNGNVSALSPSGYTPAGATIDMVAPGDLGFAACTPDPARFTGCVNLLGRPSDLEAAGGTSESAALVAGAAALVIQAWRGAHHGQTPRPPLVRRILLSNAADLRAPATDQGAGQLDSLKAVESAANTPRPTVREDTRLTSVNQLSYTGAPGATASWAVTVTNTGVHTQPVSVSGHAFGPPRPIASTVMTLSDTASPSTASPGNTASSGHFTSWDGLPANYAAVSFTVPAGAALLSAAIGYPARPSAMTIPNAPVRLVLLTPSHRFAAHSQPQGASGSGTVEVARPQAGSWTAVIMSTAAAAGGTAGKVSFTARVANDAPFASVAPPSARIRTGHSVTFTVRARVPAGAGDASGEIVLDAGDGPTSIPVTVRGLIAMRQAASPPTLWTGSFQGIVTGGDGRPGGGQMTSYQFTVPPGTRNIDADITLPRVPASEVTGYLIAPGGQTLGYGASSLTTGFTSDSVPEQAPQRVLSAFAANPAPGTWTLVVGFSGPAVAGSAGGAPTTSPVPFTGTMRFNIARTLTASRPLSAATVLPRGKPFTFAVQVTNMAAAPEDVFLDARLPVAVSYPLAPQSAVAAVRLPLAPSGNPPEWIVPTHAVTVQARVSSAQPVMIGFGPFPGYPRLAAAPGAATWAQVPASGPAAPAAGPGAPPAPATPGLWYAIPPVIQAGPATATMRMTAAADEFDPAVSTPQGDFWRFAVTPLAPRATYSLLRLNPGQTVKIPVTMTPTAPSGSVVSGTLYVDDFTESMSFLSGSEIAALPYRYTVR
jgi:subtilase family protein